MSRYNLERVLRRELRELNEQIDLKIIKGLSYAREARRHRFIMDSLARVRRENSASWLTRSFSII